MSANKPCNIVHRITTQLARSILLLLVIFATSFTHADTTTIDHVIAVVNDDVIFSSQFEDRVKAVYQQNRGKKLPPDEQLRHQVLEQLIIESLQLQIAQRSSVKISDDELQQALDSIARQNHLDKDGMEKALAQDGITFDSFKKSIAQEMLIQRIQQAAVSKRINITEQDITNFLNSEEGKLRSAPIYHIAHILIPINPDASQQDKDSSAFLAQKIIEACKDNNRDFAEMAKKYSKAEDAQTGGDLGWKKQSELPTLYADQVTQMTAGQVSQPLATANGYHILKLLEVRGAGNSWVQQTHARHILVKPSIIRSDGEAEKLLSDLRQKILAGADFSEMAKTYSEDYGSALKGGDLGWTVPGQLVETFQQAMDNTAINAISQPFQTQYGWHIVQVLERRNQDMSTEMLRQSVRNLLMKRRFDDELPVWLKQLRDEAYVDIKTADTNNTQASPEHTAGSTP